MPNKCKHDIMYKILCYACLGSTKSSLKEKISQNSSDLKVFLDYLQEIEMINYDDLEKIYTTTDAGREFMYSYEQMMETFTYKKGKVFAIQDSLLGR